MRSIHDTETPVESLLDMLHGSWKTQALGAAAELRIADRIAEGHTDVRALASACDCDVDALHRLLGSLASLGLCIEDGDGHLALTPLGDCLRDDSPDSIRAWVLWWSQHLLPVWVQLPYSVRYGLEARSRVTGEAGFSSLEKSPERAALFNTAMSELTRLVATHVACDYDFPAYGLITDLGGGQGTLLAAILARHPASRGLLFDLPHALDKAAACLAAQGVSARCTCVAGDFFDAVPENADVYMMKSILHDWDDARARDLLHTCRRAMRPDARLLVIEHLMPDRMEACRAHQSLARLDLSMLVALGARERSEAEYRALLDAAGFAVTRIMPTGMAFHLIEATPW